MEENILIIRSISIIMIMFSVIGLLAIIYRMVQQGKKELLEKLYKDGDITETTYKKYL
jgi:hypothetical protein